MEELANDLPSAVKTVELLKSQGIDKVKIYDTDSAVLKALSVFVDPNNTTDVLVPAMKNVQSALVYYKLDSGIKISSPFALSALQSSFPASSGSFKSELIEPVIKIMFDFLRETKSYLKLNAYPFFAYSANADVISIDYALFLENPGAIQKNGLKYSNLFDVQVDAVYAAIKALKYDDIDVVVTETGWPSNGEKEEIGANPENAQAYNGNLVKRVLTGGGTPLKSESKLVVYLFAQYNENKKFGPTSERNYGLFYPSAQKVHAIPFTLEQVKTWKLKPASDRKAQSQAHTKPVYVYGGETAGSNGTRTSKSPSGKGPFCVANVKSGKESLQKTLDYACGVEGGADCRSIQPGAACYDPNTLGAHATIAFNPYYQNKGRANSACYFDGAAYVVTVPPSAYFIFSFTLRLSYAACTYNFFGEIFFAS
ncbi:hypothetical protein MKX01_020884 [Papaver californicum]|nr:hypothetical protein MKX01_020884 [Papaver californicum]